MQCLYSERVLSPEQFVLWFLKTLVFEVLQSDLRRLVAEFIPWVARSASRFHQNR